MPDICSGSLNVFWASSSDFCHRGLRAQGIEAAGRLLAHISGVAGALGHDVNGSCQWMGLTRLQSVALASLSHRCRTPQLIYKPQYLLFLKVPIAV